MEYICDHCGLEFGCASGPIICLRCGAEQTPPEYKIQPMEHAVVGPLETAVRKTKPVSRLKRVFGRRKK